MRGREIERQGEGKTGRVKGREGEAGIERDREGEKQV